MLARDLLGTSSKTRHLGLSARPRAQDLLPLRQIASKLTPTPFGQNQKQRRERYATFSCFSRSRLATSSRVSGISFLP